MTVTKSKPHRKVASKAHYRHPAKLRPVLSDEAAAEFYEHEEKIGVYSEFWQNMGYYLDKGVDFPPFSGVTHDATRGNNRVRGWNGVFAFTFYWKEAAATEVKTQFVRNMAQAYGVTLEEAIGNEPGEVSVHLSGRQVKTLTRMLNRQYARGYLVWKEL